MNSVMVKEYLTTQTRLAVHRYFLPITYVYSLCRTAVCGHGKKASRPKRLTNVRESR